jgi:sporulation protein YlmC with PRC-barrel domain
MKQTIVISLCLAALTACATRDDSTSMARDNRSQQEMGKQVMVGTSEIKKEQQSQPEMGKQIVSGTQIVSDSQQEQKDQEAGVATREKSPQSTEQADLQRFGRQIGPEGNAVGVPEPGSVSDIEETRKQPDPAQMHSPEANRQITLGGSQYFVEGEVLKIEDEHYFVRKDGSGEQVNLVVNQDTNLDCAAAPAEGARAESMTSERNSPEEQAPNASGKQLQQGQRKDETARGAGFRVGDCHFSVGDRVKAEVDDMGRVTTLKYLAGKPAVSPRAFGKSAGTGELALTQQEKPGQLDMTGEGGAVPKEYTVLPVPVGGFQDTKSNVLIHRSVKDQQGEMIGTIENFIMDTHSGRIEYAVIAIEHGTHLHPVPWSAIKLVRHGEDSMEPVIDTAQYQLMPSMGMHEAKDLSPSVKQLVQEMQALRDREPRKASKREGLGVKEPAAGGPHGEDVAGGGGLSGPRELPPDKAPSFEEEGKKPD